MKKKLSIFIFLACTVFVIMGFGTIMTGHVDGNQEALFMAAYLGFFILVMGVITWLRYTKKQSTK